MATSFRGDGGLGKQSPRNAWSRFTRVIEAVQGGAYQLAEDLLEGLTYHPDLSDEDFVPYRTLLERHAAQSFIRKLNKPTDYIAVQRATGLLLPYLRRVVDRKLPEDFPNALALPAFVGANNDCRFLLAGATHLSEYVRRRDYRVHIAWTPSAGADVAKLARSIANQEFDATIEVTVFDTQTSQPALDAFKAQRCESGILSAEGAARLRTIAANSDLVIFLTGDIDIDEGFVARAAHLARVSDTVVQPLVPIADAGDMRTAYSLSEKSTFASCSPFREILGLNMAVPARLLRDFEPLDRRFRSSYHAARELGFRLHNAGCYFFPVRVPALRAFEDDTQSEDALVFRDLCPNLVDREQDGTYHVPKVSIYIPAYNCSKFIRQAVDSVLEQDFQDLEICIWNDGSTDKTLDIIEHRYADEPRVRWKSGRNGGIGFASNNAIRMTRGIYIGQLDSDDRLKPGAIKAHVQYLDEHPEVVCCYSSCERVDSEGIYVQDEYNWPIFSRNKMMQTSIVHHFRMFRRNTWTRTTGFREDIKNGVDYDIFLKMSELGNFHHLDTKFYERRWHGENTSHAEEDDQTTNTYRVQFQALRRQGLDDFWEVHVPNKRRPRRIVYRRHPGKKFVMFWPDYTASNPYQRLLYQKAARSAEICSGTIENALSRLRSNTVRPEDFVFHMHWLSPLFKSPASDEEARAAVADFVEKLALLKVQGARLIWTVHNVISHDSRFPELELKASRAIAEMADAIHLHSAASVEEVQKAFPIDREKVIVSRHGSYERAYPDFVSRSLARKQLGLDEDADVILFTGQVRPYKGVEQLVQAFRSILAQRKTAILLIAGLNRYDPLADITPELTPEERERIRMVGRYVEDYELQLFLRSADVAVFPYKSILTSGSLLLALTYGVPAVVPSVGMTREVLDGRNAGSLFETNGGVAALETAISKILDGKESGEIETMRRNAQELARELDWPDISHLFGAAAEGAEAMVSHG